MAESKVGSPRINGLRTTFHGLSLALSRGRATVGERVSGSTLCIVGRYPYANLNGIWQMVVFKRESRTWNEGQKLFPLFKHFPFGDARELYGLKYNIM